MPALLALENPPELVALGGQPDVVPSYLERVAERAHPPTNAGWTLVGIPRAAAEARVDVIHAPAYTAPFWSPAPVVLTIHDISYERNPEWYPYRRDWLRRAFYRRSARAADHILTCSWFSASEIADMYAIGPERLTVVPLGLYFKKGMVKVELGICRGKKLHDKRESLKKKEDQRYMAREGRRDRD